MAEAKVVLSAVDQTRSAVESAKRNMESLSHTVEQAKDAVELFIGSEIVRYMYEWAKGIIETGDAMNDLSQRVGIAVEDLAKYQMATAQSGTTMESLAKGIKGLSTNMVEHADILKAAGVTATTADGAMIQLADIFASMPDGVGKTVLAVKLFGKAAGMDLIPMLNLGSAGLKESAEKSAKYAEVLKVLAPQADKFNDNMAEFALHSKVAGMSMMNNMLPALTKISAQMAIATQEGGALAGVWAGLSGVWTEGWGQKLEIWRHKALAAIDEVDARTKRFLGWNDDAGKFQNSANEHYLAIQKLLAGNAPVEARKTPTKKVISPEIQALIDALSKPAGAEVLSEYDKLVAKLGGDVAKAAADAEAAQMGYNKAQTEFVALKMGEVWAGLTKQQKEVVSKLFDSKIASEQLADATKKIAKADLDAAIAREKFNVSLIEGLSKYQEESEALRESNARLGLNKVAIAALDAIKLESKATTLDLMAIKVLDRNLDESQYQIYKAQADELRSQAKLKKEGAAKASDIDAKAAADKLSEEAAKSLHDDVKNALSTAFRDSKDPIGAFGDALGNVIYTRVTNSLADALATQFLNSAMVKSFTSIFGFANGGIMSSGGPVPLNAYASGGIANSPQLALFGEGRMNEAFVPLPDGRSIPVSMQGGGQPITININASVGDIASKSDVVKGMRATANQIVSQISRNQRYGGALA